MPTSTKLKVFLMDKASSPQFYKDELEMEGDPIEIPFEPGLYVFKTKISKSEHVLGDPLFDCAVYTANNSFDNCRKKEVMDIFEREIGCQPPPIADDKDKMYNKKFEFSEKRSCRMNELFWSVAIPDGKSRCKNPYTKSKYTTRRYFKTPIQYANLNIVFDQKIAVVQTRFSINAQTFLTQSGGFIGVGRTSLWILVSLLGVCQVKDRFSYFPDTRRHKTNFQNFQAVRKIKSYGLWSTATTNKREIKNSEGNNDMP